MKKIALFLSLILVVLFSSCKDKNSFTLDGNFGDNTYEGKTVYIYHETEDSIGTAKRTIIDSAIIKDSKFQAKGKLTQELALGLITIGKFEEMEGYDDNVFPPTNIVLEGGNIKFSYSKTAISISGTPKNDELNKIYEQISKILVIRDEFIKSGKTGEESMGEYQQKAEPISKELSTVSYNFIKANITNKVGEYYFKASLGMLTKEQINELLKMANSDFRNQPQLVAFEKRLNRVIPDTGTAYADVELADTNGLPVPLSNYVGKSKLVLVDFWASWCGPCIQEMPNLVATYGKYKAKGLEIVGVSVDEDKQKWVSAIKANKMNWIQLIDATASGSEIYGVSSIPFTLLIDQNGTVLAKNLRGKALDDKIAEILK